MGKFVQSTKLALAFALGFLVSFLVFVQFQDNHVLTTTIVDAVDTTFVPRELSQRQEEESKENIADSDLVIEYKNDLKSIHFWIKLSCEFEFTNNSLPKWVNLSLIHYSNDINILAWYRVPKTGGTEFVEALKTLGSKESKSMIHDFGVKAVQSKYSHIETHAWNGMSRNEENMVMTLFKNQAMKQVRQYKNNHNIDNDNNDNNDIDSNDNVDLNDIPPMLLHGHLRLVNNWEMINMKFSQSRLKIKFMTLIRDPISRIVSFYYYIRGRSGGWRTFPAKHDIVEAIVDDTKNYTLSDCVINMYDNFEKINKDKNTVCGLSENYLTLWYCGTDKQICNPNDITSKSLLRAMKNIDIFLDFVGLLNEFEFSIYLFKHKFPSFFDSIDRQNNQRFLKRIKDFSDKAAQKRHKSGYSTYPKPTQSIIDLLTIKNKYDVLLYQWISKRFYKYLAPLKQQMQKEQLKLK